MARLRFLDNSGDIEVTRFDRPAVEVDKNLLRREWVNKTIRFRVVNLNRHLDLLDSMRRREVQIELSDGETVLALQGFFDPAFLSEDEARARTAEARWRYGVAFLWTTCIWMEGGRSELTVTRDKFEYRGTDYEGR